MIRLERRYLVVFLLLFVSLGSLASLLPFNMGNQSQVTPQIPLPSFRMLLGSFTTPVIPNLQHVTFGSLQQSCNQFIDWLIQSSSHNFRLIIGSFTSEWIMPQVYAAGSSVGNNITIPNYVNPSLAQNGSTYTYTTSFGIYTLTPSSVGGTYLITFASSDNPSTIISTTGMVVLENSSGSFQPFSNTVLAPNELSLTNTRFRATWNVSGTGKYSKTTIATIILQVDFGRTSFPKISSQLVKAFYQLDTTCVSIVRNPCATAPYWNDDGLIDFQWDWIVVPTVGYDTLQSSSLGPVTISTISTVLNGRTDLATSNVHFTGTKNWFADWDSKGKKSVQLTTSNVLTNLRAVIVPFDLNDDSIDPDFGITSTGSTSYPLLLDSVSSSASSFKWCLLFLTPITARASGVLATVGVDVQENASNGKVILAMYSAYDVGTGTASGLLGQSAATTEVAGWNDLTIGSNPAVVSGTTYFLGFVQQCGTATVYYGSGVTSYNSGAAYGAWTDPFTPGDFVSSATTTIYMRMTYNHIKGD